MNVELKVKVKSLAAEARIIRDEERKIKSRLGKGPHKSDAHQHKDKDTLASLQNHRRGVVRHEQRHSLLAYGFLRGVAYRRMEPTCRVEPDWGKVLKMVERFGGKGKDNEFKSWREAA